MNLYEVLGVARTATLEEIKKSYRTLARQYHPDVNPNDPSVVVRFKEIANAYEIIGNPNKRSEYDVKGYVGRRPSNYSEPKPTPKPKPVKTPTESNDNPSSNELNAIECSFFGNTTQGGRNIMAHLKVSKDELKLGGRKFVKIKKRETCNRCVGDGFSQIACGPCGGSGRIGRFKGFEGTPCWRCQGLGYDSKPCSVCKGIGVDKWVVKDICITIPANSQPGQQVTIIGEGETCPKKAPGYLRVVLLA